MHYVSLSHDFPFIDFERWHKQTCFPLRIQPLKVNILVYLKAVKTGVPFLSLFPLLSFPLSYFMLALLNAVHAWWQPRRLMWPPMTSSLTWPSRHKLHRVHNRKMKCKREDKMIRDLLQLHLDAFILWMGLIIGEWINRNYEAMLSWSAMESGMLTIFFSPIREANCCRQLYRLLHLRIPLHVVAEECCAAWQKMLISLVDESILWTVKIYAATAREETGTS